MHGTFRTFELMNVNLRPKRVLLYLRVLHVTRKLSSDRESGATQSTVPHREWTMERPRGGKCEARLPLERPRGSKCDARLQLELKSFTG